MLPFPSKLKQEKKIKCLKHYFKEFPQVPKAKKQKILKELNLNLHIPIRTFTAEQSIKLHTKLEYSKGSEALLLFKLAKIEQLKKLKRIGLQRAIRIRRGLPIKGRTHSNGKSARRSYIRKLINQK